MGEPYEIGQRILAICTHIEKIEKRVAEFAKSEKLASALAEYDKAMEMAVAQLQSDGCPATNIRDKAKGMCKEQLFLVKSLEIKWKAMLSILEATKARLNGFQSYNKYLSEA